MDKALRSSATPWRMPGAVQPSLIVLFLLIAAIALTGGSARSDVGLLLVLRPVTVLCLTLLMLTAPRLDWKPVRAPLILLGLFALTIAIQLVPLPPSIWHMFGGRERYLDVLENLGAAQSWQPIAIAPDRAWNSLVSLLIPLAVLVGYASLTEEQRRKSLVLMLVLILLSAAFGALQIVGGVGSPLYYYEFMHRGLPDGLLANRNHQAALLALALPLLRAWSLVPGQSSSEMRTRGAAALALAAFLIIVSLVTGSRAGLAMMCIAIVGAFLIDPKLPGSGLSPRMRWVVPTALAAGFAAMVALVVQLNRAVAIDRLFGINILDTEERLANTPTSLQIINDTLPTGSGFGSFVAMFNSYEPDALLKPTYFNNAHNDLIELALTGGIPSLLVLGLFVLWWAWMTYRSFFATQPSRFWRGLQRAAALGIAILLAASMTDYPLRTPLLAAVFALLCCWLAHAGTRAADAETPGPDARR